MSDINLASYDEWLDAYEAAYRNAPLPYSQRCPNCGNQTLRLIFTVAHEGDRSATAIFWCESCLYGLFPSRCLLPEGAVAGSDGEVPNYRIVPPDPTS